MSWEQRWHPLRGEWVVICAHRQDRPWIGERAPDAADVAPEYVPDCYLCPGNTRISGAVNDDFASTFVFDNDLPCVSLDAPGDLDPAVGINRNQPARGIARVVCYSPQHNVTLAEFDVPHIVDVLTVWQAQYRDLGRRPLINHVLIFENKGEAVGVSNPHPHCQIYATGFVSRIIEIEQSLAEQHLKETGHVMLADVIEAERADGRRILLENDTAIAFVPYFARYAYETYIAPKATCQSIADLDEPALTDLAVALKHVLVKYDNLWRMSMPYVMALHQAPTDGREHPEFHFHVEIYPPLRKPGVLKYLAGAEIGGGNFLSDTIPEQKAAELNALPGVHYKQASV